MQRFLASVAQNLWEHYGEDISSLRIVVPNMRSRLFFADALSSMIADRPIWQPTFTTIDELIVEASGLNHIDPIRAVIELYKVYSEHHCEELDRFYFWGEILLADFDQIDKYRIDADMLFSNMRDLRAMEDDYAYMTTEQKEVVRRFWENFGQERELGQIKSDFLSIWNSLGTIYNSFRERLRNNGVGYGGMLYRDVAEQIKRGEELNIQQGQYIVVGFNALSECEKILFDRLHTELGAEFFWDTDNYYIENDMQEAGLFLRDNIVRYPNAAYFRNETDNFTRTKTISVTAAPSASMQCRNVAHFLNSLPKPPDKETAIVLADEGLLTPVLYSLPKDLTEVNVTMGYPVRGTLAYIEVEKWLKEAVKGKQTDFSDLADTLVGFMSGLADNIPSEATDYDRRLQRECLGVMAEAVHKLKNSLIGSEVELSTKLFAVLVRRVLQRLRIPYSGEPLAGVQIMGILETRNLDFKNVMVLSMNDDWLPATHNASSSFIPYNLRYGYGLPTPTHHDAVFAYYFYRLIQRAEKVELVYPSSGDNDRAGEPSRYIYQLEYESPHEITHRDIGLHVTLPQAEHIVVSKSKAVMQRLAEYLTGGERTLSPTALNKYLTCPLQFYFHSVEHLRVPDEETTEIDASTFGNILHKAMELLYSPLKDIHNPSAQIKALIGSDKVWEAIDTAIFKITGAKREDYDGETMLTRETIAKYINGSVLPFDTRQTGWTIIDTEHPLKGSFKFGAEQEIRFAGISDRVDKLDDGTIRIVDYKTGKMQKDFAGIEAMFSPEKQAKSGAMVQTFVYSMMMYDEGSDVIPALYYVRAMNSADYSPYIAPKDVAPQPYSTYRTEFEDELRTKLSEIYNPAVAFTQCEDTRPCAICDFAKICNRI